MIDLSCLTRNNPFFQEIAYDSTVSKQEVVNVPGTNEQFVINHRRFVPGTTYAKRRPLGK